MSAPEVGDRVRVHGEPFRGQYGHVADPTLVASAYLWDLWVTLDGDTGPHGFALNEVEKVPTTPDNPPQSDEQGADLLADPDGVCGAQNGRVRFEARTRVGIGRSARSFGRESAPKWGGELSALVQG